MGEVRMRAIKPETMYHMIAELRKWVQWANQGDKDALSGILGDFLEVLDMVSELSFRHQAGVLLLMKTQDRDDLRRVIAILDGTGKVPEEIEAEIHSTLPGFLRGGSTTSEW